MANEERYDFTETDDVSGFIIDGGLQRLSMAEVARRLNDAPRWMDRPDRPGLWLCARIKTGEYGEMPDVAINLTQEEIDKGAPFVSTRVYGPIPEDVQ